MEETLLKAAEGYKGTDNIRTQLLKEALLYDITVEEAIELVDKVLARLDKTETGKQGGAFGVAHNPVTQTQNLGKRIASLRSW